MINIDEIILKRKYYFSLPPEQLFENLIYREVPVIPKCSCDHISKLYDQYDWANDLNYYFDYHRQITLKAVTQIKEPYKRYNSPRTQLKCGRRTGLLHPIIIWKYIDKSVIVRLHD